MKILYYGEGPWAGTGLAQVTRNIIDPLAANGHHIELVATNHPYEITKGELPYIIHPSDEDCANIAKCVERIKEGDYDCFFYSADFGRYGEVWEALSDVRQTRPIITVMYSPVDCDIMPKNSFGILDAVNVAITYTHHGKSVILKQNPDAQVSVVYLACELEKFYPLSQNERRQARLDLFGINDDETFLVINVNRNQPRKDLGRSIAIFHEFHKRHANSRMYLHAQKIEKDSGNLELMARSFDALSDFIFTGDDYGIYNGFNFETMNRIYNAADCFFSTSTGEGWGLATTEAMCAGCPVVVPNNTAFREIIGSNQERGLLIKTGGDIDHLTWLYGFVDNPREVVHAKSALDQLHNVWSNRRDAVSRAIRARRWCHQWTPDIIGKQWVTLFDTLEKEVGK